jgi:diguanylate cyclase
MGQLGPDPRDALLELRSHVLEMRELMSAGSNANLGAAVQVLASATLDPLTNLPNRRVFDSRARMLEVTKIPFVIAMINLDKFKTINDRFGHTVADRVLAVVGRTLQHHLHMADMLARFGGDEFVALFPAMSSEDVANVLRSAMPPVEQALARNEVPPLTASAGISSDGDVSFEEKLNEADRALYQAKREGGNAVMTFG